LEQSQFLSTLLRDPGLASALSRKISWNFDNLEIFFALLMSVPEMSQNTRKIRFIHLEHGLDFAINRLSLFSCITDLSISGHVVGTESEQLIDLNAIVHSCPLLRDLRLTWFLKYRGSLQPAANLRKLYLYFGVDDNYDAEFTQQLMPVNSAPVLECFRVDHLWDGMEMSGFQLLDTFVNLQHLAFSWVTAAVDMLFRAKFVLTSLEIDYLVDSEGPPTSEFVASIFSASSLAQLRELRFEVDDILALEGPEFEIQQLENELDKIEPIIYGITNLRYLETLRLRFPLRISWCNPFARLRNLRSLDYNKIWNPPTNLCISAISFCADCSSPPNVGQLKRCN